MQQKTILIVAVTIVLTTVCVSLIFIGGLGVGLGLTGGLAPAALGPQQPATDSPPDYSPPERPLPRGQLLLEDDFSRQEWEAGDEADHRKGYANGQYFIVVDTSSYNFWSVAGESLRDFVIEVETVHLAGPEDNDYGLILRHQDDTNFYSFEISSDGFYTFTKLVDDELYEIIPWQQSDAINPGADSNRLRVEAGEASFTFYINDERVDAAFDTEFDQGDIGLIAGAYEEAGVHIAFDNLKIWAVE